jgi:hypothetical protein
MAAYAPHLLGTAPGTDQAIGLAVIGAMSHPAEAACLGPTGKSAGCPA